MQGIEKQGKMVAVHAGVADGKREGKGKCAVRLGIFPEGEKREKIGRAAVINGAIRRIIEPRHAEMQKKFAGCPSFTLMPFLF